MRLLKKQNYEERINAIKEWLKSEEILSHLMKQVQELYGDCEEYQNKDDLVNEMIEDYFRMANTKDGEVIKNYSRDMLMNARGIQLRNMKRYIYHNWIAVGEDQPWFDEDRICQEMGCREIYVGDGMWWDNVNKRHYCK